jgi:branched-chain amino acid transport system permease protein
MDLASLILAQSLSGLTNAMFLFLMASGLSLIFGVLRLLNFAHGSFYMLGAYVSYQIIAWLGNGETFWFAALVAACTVAVLGGLVERFLLRRLYDRPELVQLLFTYALILIVADGAKMIWGTKQHSVMRPPSLSDGFQLLGTTLPAYNLFILILGPAIAIGLWAFLQRSSHGRVIRAAALDREMLGALGINVERIYMLVFMAGSFLAGLAGALVTPITVIVPGMDSEIIIALFIIVVIGGLGSFWGTFFGSIIYGLVLAFGILVMPRFSLFAVAALMAVVLVIKPTGLFAQKATR